MLDSRKVSNAESSALHSRAEAHVAVAAANAVEHGQRRVSDDDERDHENAQRRGAQQRPQLATPGSSGVAGEQQQRTFAAASTPMGSIGRSMRIITLPTAISSLASPKAHSGDAASTMSSEGCARATR